MTEGNYEEFLEEESYDDDLQDSFDEDTDEDLYSAEEEAFMRGYKNENASSIKKKKKEEFTEDEDY